MVNKTILKKTEQLYEKLKLDLEYIELEEEDFIRISELSLFKIDEAVRGLKSLLTKFEFECAADEIYFFKNLKPLFISKFIYHSRVIDILTYLPAAGLEAQLNYYRQEIEKLTLHHDNHIEFYSYYRRGATYLDQKYFLRRMYDLKMSLPSGLYNYDENFTTSHDHLVAQILAHRETEIFINLKIEKLRQYGDHNAQAPTTLVWSESKVSLVELVYGLFQLSCFNGGNIELSEVIRFTEKTFNIDLGNYHKTIFEIRNRKQGPTKFLQMVNDHLVQHFNKMDDFQ
ncbi:RteC domain-containing protein [Chryseobacterium sp. Leaf394]|uniref:RteC domain-containing protein n=1 Tax=Chryseobacterium sp. Leaf394 TaxID=1736361 RepID=UPI0006FFC071|nr:RteC domain-containing protein [Chryseobacterium sp. Leaf394]KQS91763.1 RteC protein [Chryseobacterium sp. Leaf394]